MSMSTVSVSRSPIVEEAISLAPEALSIPADTSDAERVEAWLAFALERYHEHERLVCVRSATRAAIDAGLL